MIPIDYRIIPADEIVLDKKETAKRLLSGKDYTNDTVEEMIERLKTVVNCKFSAIRTKVVFLDENRLDLGFGEIKSKMLFKNLIGCKEAFVFVVTLGFGVEKLLSQLSLISPAKHFICDALASTMAEAATDKAEKMIKGKLNCKPRVSPGYGDLPLEIQPEILKLLNAQRLLGVTVNNSLLMSPMKSVTAVMGIKNE